MALSRYDKEAIRQLWQGQPKLSAEKIGWRFGVTRNAIISLAHRSKWGPRGAPPTADPLPRYPQHYVTEGLPHVTKDEVIMTLFDRCALMHAAMDRVLRECEPHLMPKFKPAAVKAEGQYPY